MLLRTGEEVALRLEQRKQRPAQIFVEQARIACDRDVRHLQGERDRPAEVEALDPEDRLVARKLEAGRELAGQSPRCPEHARRRVETSARGDVGREESCEPVRLLLDRRRPYEQPAPRT